MNPKTPCTALITILLAVLLLPPLALAQSAASTAPQRPRIALVLEGGSALGLAHIGVIDWLEQHHVPISYVAGTSMGGLVGGLYATGQSPDEMRQFVAGIDWPTVLRGEIAYEDLTYRRKEDRRDYPNAVELGVRHGVRLPEGLNSGHYVGLLFDRVALPYSTTRNFDDLPIPFACVGTDLVTGKEYVFRSGSLAEALRSTMSLPAMFAPVRSGDHIFADGGLLNNLPVDVARQMGADLVIAVHLQVKAVEPKDRLSAFGVLGRSVSVAIAANELREMQQADVLITVNVAGFDVSDYQRSAELIARGLQAAAAKSAILSTLSVDDAAWRDYLAARNARRKTTPPPAFVEVAGVKPSLAQDIKQQLSPYVNRPLDTAALEEQLTLLTGSGRYSSVGYEMVDNNGQIGLRAVADEKSYGPPFIRPLIVVDGSDRKHIRFTIGARVTFLDLGLIGAEWRNDITLGSDDRLFSEYYRPLRHGSRWFVAPQMLAESTAINAYSGSKMLAEYGQKQMGGGADLGYSLGRNSEIRLGYYSAYRKLWPQIGDPETLPRLDGRLGTTRLRYSYTSVDNPNIPRSGYIFQARAQWFDASPGASQGFPLAEIDAWSFRRISKAASLVFTAAGGSTFGYNETGLPPFSLGGPRSLSAYGTNELFTNQYFLFRAGYLRELLPLNILGDKLYAFGGWEVAKVYDVSEVSRLPNDFVGAVLVNTMFGPAQFGFSVGDMGHRKLFFSLERVF
jgi:NTE family protein